jgi:hypothetical protein
VLGSSDAPSASACPLGQHLKAPYTARRPQVVWFSGISDVIAEIDYESVLLMLVKTVLIAEATLFTPVTEARATRVISSAYSTKSWPSSPYIRS